MRITRRWRTALRLAVLALFLVFVGVLLADLAGMPMLRPGPFVDELWREFVNAMNVDAEMKSALIDPAQVDDAIRQLPQSLAKVAYSASHTTFSPNMCRAGVKTNVIPDVVDIEVDIRTVPGDNEDEVKRHLDKALGDLAEEVQVEKLFSKQASISPTGTPLWDTLARVLAEVRRVRESDDHPRRQTRARVVAVDHGAVAYGFGLFSRAMTAESMAGRFHGNDERIDVESLGLTTQAWLDVCELFLG